MSLRNLVKRLKLTKTSKENLTLLDSLKVDYLLDILSKNVTYQKVLKLEISGLLEDLTWVLIRFLDASLVYFVMLLTGLLINLFIPELPKISFHQLDTLEMLII